MDNQGEFNNEGLAGVLWCDTWHIDIRSAHGFKTTVWPSTIVVPKRVLSGYSERSVD